MIADLFGSAPCRGASSGRSAPVASSRLPARPLSDVERERLVIGVVAKLVPPFAYRETEERKRAALALVKALVAPVAYGDTEGRQRTARICAKVLTMIEEGAL